MSPRRCLLAISTVIAVVSLSDPALAHVDPDPTEAQAGSRTSVGFTVQHGCDGSPTTQLDMRLPDGVTGPQPQPPEGWVGSVESNVVTFAGGPLPDEQSLTFRVLLTLPPTPDVTIYFPFVQRCEVGEIRWIAIPSDGSGADLDEPAPAMRLVGPVATTSPATTAAAVVASSLVEPSTLPTTAPRIPSITDPSETPSTTSTTSAPEPSLTVATTDGPGGPGSSDAGTALFAGTCVLITGVATFLVVRSRRRK